MSTNDPLDQTRVIGSTQFQVDFTPSSAVGTYSYSVGPNVSDAIESYKQVVPLWAYDRAYHQHGHAGGNRRWRAIGQSIITVPAGIGHGRRGDLVGHGFGRHHPNVR